MEADRYFNRGKPWTTDEDDTLRRWWVARPPLGQLCQIMHRPAYEVANRLRALNLIPSVEPPMTMHAKTPFWVIQNGELTGQNDKYGNPTLVWPGKSVFFKEEDAIKAAEALAEAEPTKKYFVTKSVMLIETTKPPIKRKPIK